MNQDTLDLMNSFHTTNVLIGDGGLASVSRGAGNLAPWIIPPDGFDSFDEVNSIALDVIGNTTTILSILVPNGYDGVIKRFYHNYLGTAFVEGSGDIIWRILADGRPIKNYGAILTQMGNAQTPRLTDGIRIYAGQTISYIAYHAANALLLMNSDFKN